MKVIMGLLLGFLLAYGQQFVDQPEPADARDFAQWGMKIKCDDAVDVPLCKELAKQVGVWWKSAHNGRRVLVCMKPLFGGYSIRVFVGTLSITQPTGPATNVGGFNFEDVGRFGVTGTPNFSDVIKNIQQLVESKRAKKTLAYIRLRGSV
ncbi:MAG: hypothetical protein JNK33_00980 [Candidatus Doudnabacteria bacterium]|nr:hypothetical protein [Candidatus Doudnabacteria bacterium]